MANSLGTHSNKIPVSGIILDNLVVLDNAGTAMTGFQLAPPSSLVYPTPPAAQTVSETKARFQMPPVGMVSLVTSEVSQVVSPGSALLYR